VIAVPSWWPVSIHFLLYHDIQPAQRPPATHDASILIVDARKYT
jgi:hypothetical protein